MVSEAEGAPAGRGVWQVLFSALSLLLVLAAFAFALKPPAPEPEWADIVGKDMVVGELPAGLSVLTKEQLPGGRTLALLGDPTDMPPAGEMASVKSMGFGGKGMGAEWEVAAAEASAAASVAAA
ncbi:MAG: hypothetical protein R3F33_08145 [Planctomycetota bacterium]